MTSVVICEAQIAHAHRIAALHVASWRDAYRSILDPDYLDGPLASEKLDLWREQIIAGNGRTKVMVALDQDDLAGFICLKLGFDGRWGALIDNLHTDPALRGRGVGAALLRSAASMVVDKDPTAGLHLYVFAENLRARTFYERHGGVPAGSIRSEIPSARGASVLRVHWPKAADVV